MAVKTYDVSQAIVIFGGPMSGFAEDTAVSVEMNEDLFTLQMGVDGKGTRSRTSNNSARITVSLMQTSVANDILSGIAAVDRASGLGIIPLTVKDGSGRTLFAAESAWITRIPTVTLGREAGAVEWVLETDNIVSYVGGN